MFAGVQASVVIDCVAIIAAFTGQWIMDAIAAERDGAIDIAFGTHFGDVAVFWKLNDPIAANGLCDDADSKIKRTDITLRAFGVALTS